jgi:hypothetical protein
MTIIGANNPKKWYQLEYHAEGCAHIKFLEPRSSYRWESIAEAEAYFAPFTDEPPRVIAPCARRAD